MREEEIDSVRTGETAEELDYGDSRAEIRQMLLTELVEATLQRSTDADTVEGKSSVEKRTEARVEIGESIEQVNTIAILEDLEEHFVRQLLESCHDERMCGRSIVRIGRFIQLTCARHGEWEQVHFLSYTSFFPTETWLEQAGVIVLLLRGQRSKS